MRHFSFFSLSVFSFLCLSLCPFWSRKICVLSIVPGWRLGSCAWERSEGRICGGSCLPTLPKTKTEVLLTLTESHLSFRVALRNTSCILRFDFLSACHSSSSLSFRFGYIRSQIDPFLLNSCLSGLCYPLLLCPPGLLYSLLHCKK